MLAAAADIEKALLELNCSIPVVPIAAVIPAACSCEFRLLTACVAVRPAIVPVTVAVLIACCPVEYVKACVAPVERKVPPVFREWRSPPPRSDRSRRRQRWSTRCQGRPNPRLRHSDQPTPGHFDLVAAAADIGHQVGAVGTAGIQVDVGGLPVDFAQ